MGIINLVYNYVLQIFIAVENYAFLVLGIRNANSNNTVSLGKKIPFLSGKQEY